MQPHAPIIFMIFLDIKFNFFPNEASSNKLAYSQDFNNTNIWAEIHQALQAEFLIVKTLR